MRKYRRLSHALAIGRAARIAGDDRLSRFGLVRIASESGDNSEATI